MIESKIEIKNLSKIYKDSIVLDSISLDIKKGDFVTLLGPSGCGKTTLLNILGGFLDFNSGEIKLDSKIYTKSLPLSNDRIKVFQNYILLPWKDALSQVLFALESIKENRKVNKKILKNRAIESLNLVGLQNHLHKYPHELSGGQQSRVSIARALAVKPQILLMDEPFGALDNFTRINLQNELKNIVKNLQTTCIFVTHDIEEALFLGNKVVVMGANGGKILNCIENKIPKDRNDIYLNALKEEINGYLSMQNSSDKKQQQYII